MVMRRRTNRFCRMTTALLLSGCGLSRHRPPAELQPPAADVTTEKFSGTALSGPLPEPIPAAAVSDVWSLRCSVSAVRRLPVADFSPIGPLARLVVSDAGGELVVPSTRLVYSTLLQNLKANSGSISINPADRASMAELSGAVARGSSTAFEIAAKSASPDQPSRLRLSVSITRTADSPDYDLAISSEDQLQIRRGARHSSSSLKRVRELIVVSRKLNGTGDHFVLAVPMQFGASSATGIVLDLQVDSQPANQAELASELKTDLATSAAGVAASLAKPVDSVDDLQIDSAISAFASSDRPKASLSYLAQQSGAKLAGCVVLVANDELLALIAKNVRQMFSKPGPRDRVSVAWMLDRSTVAAVASIKDDETNKALPAAQGALENYAGEAGRQLDVLQSLANEATSSEDLDHRILAEQIIDLEDESPAVRVRAFDFLRGKQQAPPNFDPLAPAKQRRDALEKFHDAQTLPATNR